MSKLHIYRGVPASGKSTFAMEWVKESPSTRIRINRDDIRFSNFGAYWGVDEGLVTSIQDAIMSRAMKKGLDIVSDQTNLVAKNVRQQMELAEKWGYGVEFHDFPISLNEALERDAAREKQVGEKVIKSFFRRFIGKDGVSLPPPPAELKAVKFKKHKHKKGLPHAILVDVDGTLAHHEDVRGPHDTTKYHLDKPDPIIARIVEAAGYHGVFIMSGRDETYRDVLVDWLADNLGWYEGQEYDGIFMRPAGDRRNDAIVKNELFETHLAGKFNIDFVLDDRDRVVQMWRAKGIKCLQVQEGEF